MSARLILVRHGESTWNAERRLQGQADPSLSALGREQAVALASVVSALAPDRAVCSDLERARETAVLLGFPEAEPDARLREINLGEWQGRLIDDVRGSEPEDYDAWRIGRFTPAGGEPFPAFAERVAGALTEIGSAGGSVLVATHGGCVRAACTRLLDVPAAVFAPVLNASITTFDLDGARPRLAGYNLTAVAGTSA